jgi:hypothetical protein
MLTNSARLARLERHARNTLPPAMEWDAVVNGTASLDEYALELAQPISQFRDTYLAEAVGYVAVVHSPFRYLRWPQCALAYPPDRPLREYDEATIRFLYDCATKPVETTDLTAHTKRGGFDVLDPVTRAENAVQYLALGGQEALGLREAVWTCRNDLWEVRQEVWVAGEERKVGLYAGHAWQEVDGLYRAWRDGEIGDSDDRFAQVSVADIARFVGLPQIESTKSKPCSDQVK